MFKYIAVAVVEVHLRLVRDCHYRKLTENVRFQMDIIKI